MQKQEHLFVGRGASDVEICHAEALLALRIPEDYRWFLTEFGWGGAGSWELFGLGVDVPSFLDLVKITQSERSDMRPRLQRHLLPIMNDGGGNLYCLDTSMDAPSVVFWDHTQNEDQTPEIEATDFLTWLGELVGGFGK